MFTSACCPGLGRPFPGSPGNTDAQINSHSRNESLSREHHVDHGLRILGKNSFLLVEGSGTLDRVVIEGNTFAVTQVFDPSKKSLSPSLPFRIYAIPLRKEDTE
jgi:hypothetical protein